MENFRISLEDDELVFVKEQGKGWLRDVVRRFMDAERTALTPAELIYLRDHGGTKGVISIARGEKSEGEFEPVTGQVLEDPTFEATYYGADGSKHVKRGYPAAQAISPDQYQQSKEQS